MYTAWRTAMFVVLLVPGVASGQESRSRPYREEQPLEARSSSSPQLSEPQRRGFQPVAKSAPMAKRTTGAAATRASYEEHADTPLALPSKSERKPLPLAPQKTGSTLGAPL